MKNEQGFSLVELLIVVAIIAIIAAIAVPSLLTSRMAANESAAIQACRTLGSAEIAFAAAANQQYGQMLDLVNGAFIDSRWANPADIAGYAYTENQDITAPVSNMVVGGPLPDMFGFLATANGTSARYDYEIGVDQVVRWGPTVPPVGGMAQHDPLGQ